MDSLFDSPAHQLQLSDWIVRIRGRSGSQTLLRSRHRTSGDSVHPAPTSLLCAGLNHASTVELCYYCRSDFSWVLVDRTIRSSINKARCGDWPRPWLLQCDGTFMANCNYNLQPLWPIANAIEVESRPCPRHTRTAHAPHLSDSC